MQKLVEPNTVPPDGYRYFQAETKTWIRASDYRNLFANVHDHRKANNLPIGTFWESEVEDQLCQSLPPGQCKQTQPGAARSNFTRVGWPEIVAGTKTIFSWASGGLKFADQALADARSDICSRCYYNVPQTGGCHACGQVQKLASTLVGTRRTKGDPFLKVCAVCRCALQAKVWVPIEAIEAGMTEALYDKYPDFCWQKREVNAFRKAKDELGVPSS